MAQALSLSYSVRDKGHRREKVMQEKEDKTMAMLKELAKARFG